MSRSIDLNADIGEHDGKDYSRDKAILGRLLGTVLAVWTLLSLVKGVELALQSYRWLNELFFGTALIGAVGMSKVFQRRATRRAALQRQRDAAAAEAARS